MLRYFRYLALTSFFVLVFLICLHSLNSINQDIGRHLKLGEIIWQTHSVPKVNLFSFTQPDQPFINHHWLSEVVFFLLFVIIGLKGLIVFKATVITAAFGLIFLGIKKQTGTWPFLVSGFLGILVFSSRTDVRPEIFSYLFLAYFLFAIFRSKYLGQNKWLYALPAIQILWTNSHIYFVLGPGLLLFYLIERLFSKSKFEGMDKKRLLWIFIATAAATLINPNFIRGAIAPFNILKDYGYSIVENQSIFFLQNYGSGLHLQEIGIFIISVIFLVVSFVLAFKNRQQNKSNGYLIFEILTGLAFTILAAKMIRNFGIYALTLVPILSLNLSSIKNSLKNPEIKSKIIFYSATTMIFALLIFGVITNGFYRWVGDSRQFGLTIPVGAERGVEFVKQNGLVGSPVFNNFDVGSFLIWRLYPRPGEKCPKQLSGLAPHLSGASGEPERCGVFVDGRPEAYSKEFFDNVYKPMQEDPAIWQKYSKKYGIDYIFFAHSDITPWARTFLFNISQNPEWPLVYKDGSVAIFLKRTPENRFIIEKNLIK